MQGVQGHAGHPCMLGCQGHTLPSLSTTYEVSMYRTMHGGRHDSSVTRVHQGGC